MVTVSVLLPVYNNKEDVIKAILSVVYQTFTDWELIIIDDASTDGSYDVIKNYMNDNPSSKFILLKNDTNKGLFPSLNECLLKANGKYIARVDSDDIIDKTKLQKQVDIMQSNPKLVATYCHYSRNKTDRGRGEVTTLYKREIIDSIGYYDSVRFASDTEYFHRMEKKFGTKRIFLSNEILYHASIRENSLTTSNTTGIQGSGQRIRLQYVHNFMKWHNTTDKLYLSYPLIIRPFEIDTLMLSENA